MQIYQNTNPIPRSPIDGTNDSRPTVLVHSRHVFKGCSGTEIGAQSPVTDRKPDRVDADTLEIRKVCFVNEFVPVSLEKMLGRILVSPARREVDFGRLRVGGTRKERRCHPIFMNEPESGM
jgi:hypothetical protein